MSININILQNGSKKIYTNCSFDQNKDADNITLLIASLKVTGATCFFVFNKDKILNLIKEFKINLKRVKIIEINWLDDVPDKIWNIKNANVFIFDYYRLSSKPDFLEPTFPINDKEVQVILTEFDQKEIEKILLNYTTLNNIVFYIPEYEKPISVQIQEASGKFNIVTFTNGNRKEQEFYAGSIGRGYHQRTVEIKSNEKILEIAKKSSNYILIIYPLIEGEEAYYYWNDNSLNINVTIELNIKVEFIFCHFNGKNLANEKVKYPIPLDGNGEPISDYMSDTYYSRLAKEGLKPYIPSKEEIERTNSLAAIRQYIVHNDSSLLLNDIIASEIDTLLLEKIENNKIEIQAVSKNIFDLKKTIFSLAVNKDIFILEFHKFSNNGFTNYNEYEELWNWVRYNKKNFTYSIRKSFYS